MSPSSPQSRQRASMVCSGSCNSCNPRKSECLTKSMQQAVRAMRFDAGANRKKLETAESARERVIAEEELAKAMEEDDGL